MSSHTQVYKIVVSWVFGVNPDTGLNILSDFSSLDDTFLQPDSAVRWREDDDRPEGLPDHFVNKQCIIDLDVVRACTGESYGKSKKLQPASVQIVLTDKYRAPDSQNLNSNSAN